MKNRRNRWIGMVLAAVLVLSLALTGCGGKDKGPADPNLGLYEASSVSMAGFTMDIADVFEDGFSIELLEKGKMKLQIEGDTGNGTWTLDGDKIEIKGSGVELHGTLSNGVMLLENVMDAGMDLTLENKAAVSNGQTAKADGAANAAKDEESKGPSGKPGNKPGASLSGGNAAEKAEEDAPAKAEKTDIQKYWNGDWYGYMIIEDTDGAYVSLQDLTWDACGLIDLDVNGDGTITLWYATDDFSCASKDDPIAFAKINVSYDNGFGAYGTGMSVDGWAIADTDAGHVGDTDWVIDPDNDEFPNTLWFGDYYEDEDGYIAYQFVLRPWGNLWEDMEDDPRYYMPGFYAWYKPLVEEGWAMPMGFDEDPVKTRDERMAELLGGAENGKSGGTSKPVAGKAESGKKGSAGESYDNVKPNGSSYTWGNITVSVPAGMKTVNGGIGTPNDENSLWLQNGTKYILVQISDIDKVKSDVSTTKSINDGEDAAFSVNGVEWNAAKYEYSGSPVWQGYADVNGTIYEIMSYGYGFGDPETLTVIASLK